MATWAFEEDFIVCDYYLNHPNDWQQHLDELMDKLRERGFNRDKKSIRMRIQNYQYLDTGKQGLANAANQSQRIFDVFSNHLANAVLKANVSTHIQNTYTSKFGTGDTYSFNEDQILSPLDLSSLTEPQQNLHKLIFTLPKEPTFKDILFGFIEQKGFQKKHSDVYNAAQIKRDTFHAIKKGKNYGVSKKTVMQFCFGLRLTYDEAVVLMASAGYAFAPSCLTDVIVTYYLKHEQYDIFEVNFSLYDSGADLLF